MNKGSSSNTTTTTTNNNNLISFVNYYQCWKQLCYFIFSCKTWYFLLFWILWWIESSKEQHLFEIETFVTLLISLHSHLWSILMHPCWIKVLRNLTDPKLLKGNIYFGICWPLTSVWTTIIAMLGKHHKQVMQSQQVVMQKDISYSSQFSQPLTLLCVRVWWSALCHMFVNECVCVWACSRGCQQSACVGGSHPTRSFLALKAFGIVSPNPIFIWCASESRLVEAHH